MGNNSNSNVSVVDIGARSNHSSAPMLPTPPLQPRSLAGIGQRPFRLKPIGLAEDVSNRNGENVKASR